MKNEYQALTKHYGEKARLLKLIEELQEAGAALSRLLQRERSPDALRADARVELSQVHHLMEEVDLFLDWRGADSHTIRRIQQRLEAIRSEK